MFNDNEGVSKLKDVNLLLTFCRFLKYQSRF